VVGIQAEGGKDGRRWLGGVEKRTAAVDPVSGSSGEKESA
jgi:hypothetical protein